MTTKNPRIFYEKPDITLAQSARKNKQQVKFGYMAFPEEAELAGYNRDISTKVIVTKKRRK
jgi:hypothetical protein